MKAIRSGTFAPYQLKDKENEQLIFKELSDELRHDKNLRACIIIRSEFTGAKEAEMNGEENNDEEVTTAVEPAVEQTPAPDEVPDVDPAQMVEKWKKDLLEQYGIGENRLVVIVAPARDEYRAGEMEAWIVPNDAALPDPTAPEEEVEEPTADGEETPNNKP